MTVAHAHDVGRARSWFGPIGALAGLSAAIALAVVVIVGASVWNVQPLSSGSTSSNPSSSAARSPGSLASEPGQGPEPGLTVGAAIAIRDQQPDDREIRVAGWLRGGVPVPCPASLPPRNPTRLECPPALRWLVESEADAGVGRLDAAPAGPAFQPSFALVDDSAVPSLMAGSVPRTAPIEITVTGHFHDRRATLCASQGDCWSTFVVDRIESVDGVGQPRTTSFDLDIQVQNGNTVSSVRIPSPFAFPPSMPAEQYDFAAAPLGSAWSILSHRTMSIDGLLDTEPALAAGWPDLGTSTIVTSITVWVLGSSLGPFPARTFLFPNQSAVYYQMTSTGPVAAGTLPVPRYPDGRASRIGAPITVSAAIDRRDNALDDAELLVVGFAWEPGPLTCTPGQPGMPVLDQCPSTFTWLAEQRPATKVGELAQPTGPAINLIVPPESVGLAVLTTTPTQYAVLGHFDDRRSASCPADLVQRCRQNFIVDAVLDPGHPALDGDLATTIHPGPSNTPRGTATWAATVAGLPEDERADRLISVFPLATAALGAFEPGVVDIPDLAGVDTVWIVHFLDATSSGSVVRTRLVIDAAVDAPRPQSFEITADGVSRTIARGP
jgi:hypothetical protein